MSATPPSATPRSGQGSYEPATRHEGIKDETQLSPANNPELEEESQDVPLLSYQEPQPIEMNDNVQAESHSTNAPEPYSAKSMEATSAPPQQESLSEQVKDLSVSANTSELPTSSGTDAPPPLPEKDEAYLNTAPKSPVPPRSPANAPEWADKELPDVPGGNSLGKKPGVTGGGNRDDDSQPEIQSIMAQFKDSEHSQGGEGLTSPRLELAEQFLAGQSYFPARNSSLDHSKAGETGPRPAPSSPEKQPASTSRSLPKNAANEDAVTRRSSISTIPPMPEPEPEKPFDFHRFLEQLRHRTADPVAKFLRSFLMEFGKRQWMVHEQVKIISDFLVFITNKMALCDVWREVSDGEFDNAKEGMEKLVMNRLYSQTFSPAIPSPPAIPRSASRSKRRELERLHGPWRRGQHQEDIERDDVLAQKMGIYSWVKEEHLDIPPVGHQGRRFLNLAKQELLKINGYRAPRDKIICILNCCKVIFGLLRNTKKGDTSADSFVPLLIYVVLQANPDHLVSNIQYILRFRNQEKLGGEAGYYLSSLSGAIQFIETLDRTSLTVSDEEFERNVEATVSSIAEQNRESESMDQKAAEQPGSSQGASRASGDAQQRKDGQQSSDDDVAPVAGLLRTIQKPLSTIGRMFADEPDSQDRPTQPATTPQPGAPPRLTPSVYQPPRNSGEDGRSHEGRNATQQLSKVLDAQDAAARQASAEDAEARRIQRAEHNDVVETLSNMFPNLDREVIDDVVKVKQGRVGLAVDACLALSAE